MTIKCTITLFFLSIMTLHAQNAEKILKTYTKKSGGQKNWDKINSMQVEGTAKLISQGGMELPFKRIMKKDGKQITSLEINGMDYISIAYDGTIAWGSNAQMEAEEKDADMTKNTILSRFDFPYPGHNWKSNGFKAEYISKVTINDISTYKLKLTKRPQWVAGKEIENILFLYIDTLRYLPVLSESKVVAKGPNQGRMMKSYFSDYKAVDGYWYPFTVTMKYGEETFQVLKTSRLEWNPKIVDTVFQYNP
ncbi:hypothetical protein [Spongiimicrobium salis]|uniref:hypothetical protein n=1 Tax=Spongiimicrobium salis TaxID=1667022 RepID=UPI00374C8D84